MTPERWEQARRLLEEALEQPAAERTAWIARHAGSDRELAAEVTSLLQAHARAGEALVGEDLREVSPFREAVGISEENTFGTDVADPKVLEYERHE